MMPNHHHHHPYHSYYGTYYVPWDNISNNNCNQPQHLLLQPSDEGEEYDDNGNDDNDMEGSKNDTKKKHVQFKKHNENDDDYDDEEEDDNNNTFGSYYSILNVTRDASLLDIQKNYKMLSRIYHPDKALITIQRSGSETHHQPTNTNTTTTPPTTTVVDDSTFVLMKTAYDVLMDPIYRELYDYGGIVLVQYVKRCRTTIQSYKQRKFEYRQAQQQRNQHVHYNKNNSENVDYHDDNEDDQSIDSMDNDEDDDDSGVDEEEDGTHDDLPIDWYQRIRNARTSSERQQIVQSAYTDYYDKYQYSQYVQQQQQLDKDNNDNNDHYTSTIDMNCTIPLEYDCDKNVLRRQVRERIDDTTTSLSSCHFQMNQTRNYSFVRKRKKQKVKNELHEQQQEEEKNQENDAKKNRKQQQQEEKEKEKNEFGHYSIQYQVGTVLQSNGNMEMNPVVSCHIQPVLGTNITSMCSFRSVQFIGAQRLYLQQQQQQMQQNHQQDSIFLLDEIDSTEVESDEQDIPLSATTTGSSPTTSSGFWKLCLPKVTFHTSRQFQDGSHAVLGIGIGNLLDTNTWQLVGTSSRNLVIRTNTTTNKRNPMDQQKNNMKPDLINTTCQFGISPRSGQLNTLTLSIRNIRQPFSIKRKKKKILHLLFKNYDPQWKLRFHILPISSSWYPMKWSYQLADENTFGGSFAFGGLIPISSWFSAYRIKFVRIQTLHTPFTSIPVRSNETKFKQTSKYYDLHKREWYLKYGIKYEDRNLFTGSIWTILFQLSSPDFISMKIPIQLRLLSSYDLFYFDETTSIFSYVPWPTIYLIIMMVSDIISDSWDDYWKNKQRGNTKQINHYFRHRGGGSGGKTHRRRNVLHKWQQRWFRTKDYTSTTNKVEYHNYCTYCEYNDDDNDEMELRMTIRNNNNFLPPSYPSSYYTAPFYRVICQIAEQKRLSEDHINGLVILNAYTWYVPVSMTQSSSSSPLFVSPQTNSKWNENNQQTRIIHGELIDHDKLINILQYWVVDSYLSIPITMSTIEWWWQKPETSPKVQSTVPETKSNWLRFVVHEWFHQLSVYRMMIGNTLFGPFVVSNTKKKYNVENQLNKKLQQQQDKTLTIRRVDHGIDYDNNNEPKQKKAITIRYKYQRYIYEMTFYQTKNVVKNHHNDNHDPMSNHQHDDRIILPNDNATQIGSADLVI